LYKTNTEQSKTDSFIEGEPKAIMLKPPYVSMEDAENQANAALIKDLENIILDTYQNYMEQIS
jgi:hypothetical protein